MGIDAVVHKIRERGKPMAKRRVGRRRFISEGIATGFGMAALSPITRATLLPRRCDPLISGALLQFTRDFPPAAPDSWATFLDEQRAIGFDLVWIAHIGPALNASASEDPLQSILDLCAERHMHVILDVGATPQWYANPDVKKEMEFVSRNVAAMSERYGQHPACYAWYMPHEIYMAWDAFGAFVNDLFPAIVACCKESQPEKPVTCSPFFILDKEHVFGNFRYPEPEEYGEYWQRLIERAQFDVVMLQDSGEHFSYVTNDQRRPFYKAMKQACDQNTSKLWGNVESAEFECPSIETYVDRYGRVHHATVKDAPWRAVPLPRLEEKLRLAAEYCERIVTWGYGEFGNPSLGPEAVAWYNDYKRYYQRIMKEAEHYRTS